MDITTQHVWDYAGDGYVHRLIQNKDAIHSKNNLIDLPGAASRPQHPNSAYRTEAADNVPREKMEAMANEYTYLLTNQLDSQRRYFEEQLERAVDKASSASRAAEEACTSARVAASALQTLQAAHEAQTSLLAGLEKNVTKTTARAARAETLARELSRSVTEEKTMNEGLLARIRAAEAEQKRMTEEMGAVREEKIELEELNRDLTVFISSQEKVRELQAGGEEVEMGSVGVVERQEGQSQGQESGGGRKKKGKGRKK